MTNDIERQVGRKEWTKDWESMKALGRRSTKEAEGITRSRSSSP
jgi:hypothetical protein